MARFRNKSRALDLRVLIPICPCSSNDGKLVPPPLRSCTGNSSPMATRISITPCIGVLLVPFQKGRRSGLLVACHRGRRNKRELINVHGLLSLHDRRCSFSFVGLKNSQMKNKRRSFSFDLCILKLLKPTRWFSSLFTCCALAQENTSMIGSAV